jgi:hypothetical protein
VIERKAIDPNTPASVRARAAEAIFNHPAKAIEIDCGHCGIRLSPETLQEVSARSAGRLTSPMPPVL